MRDETSSKPEYASNSNPLKALQLIKISLLIFLLGICVVAKRKSTWPIVSWALYSEYSARFRPPEPSVSDVELRVYTATGDLHIVNPEDILSVPRDSLSNNIVEHTFQDTDISLRNQSRRYLVRAVENLLDADSEIETIQAWKMSYDVEPLKVPPIQSEAPTAEVMLASFSKKDYVDN